MAIIDINDNDNSVRKLQKEFPETTIQLVKSSVADQKDIELAFSGVMKNFKQIFVIVNCAAIWNEKLPQLTIDTNLVNLISNTYAEK